MKGCPFGICVLLFCFLGCDRSHDVVEDTGEYHEIKVMTYNILYTTSDEETAKVLQETDADIIGLQEVSAARLANLAQKINFHSYHFSRTSGNLSDQDTGILSRFPIRRFYDNGVVVQVNPNLQAAIFTVHLSPYPYEPYDFRDGIITTPQQAVSSATSLRLPEISPVLAELSPVMNMGIPVFLTGDFNEPSHLDWNAATAQNQMHFGQVVEWPVSKAITQANLFDVYRSQFPDPASFPGITWTTVESESEVYDRIDIIYQNDSDHLTLSDIRLVGGPGDIAGVTVDQYPSDHYSVVATYQLN